MIVIKYLKIISLFSIAIMILSCKSTYQSLTYSRKEYNGAEMRTDGYYFRSASEIRDDNKIRSVVMFFRNGIFTHIDAFIPPTNSLNVEKFIDSTSTIDKKLQSGKGIFLVKGDELLVEFWKYASHNPKPTGVYKGKILNDTTISITLFGDDILWHFKQYSIKTDSIFPFIN